MNNVQTVPNKGTEKKSAKNAITPKRKRRTKAEMESARSTANVDATPTTQTKKRKRRTKAEMKAARAKMDSSSVIVPKKRKRKRRTKAEMKAARAKMDSTAISPKKRTRRTKAEMEAIPVAKTIHDIPVNDIKKQAILAEKPIRVKYTRQFPKLGGGAVITLWGDDTAYHISWISKNTRECILEHAVAKDEDGNTFIPVKDKPVHLKFRYGQWRRIYTNLEGKARTAPVKVKFGIVALEGFEITDIAA